MPDVSDVTAKLADVQRRLLDLPDDAFGDRYDLLRERDKLRDEAAAFSEMIDSERTDDELLRELAAFRDQMKSIEGKRIDLVKQAVSRSTRESMTHTDSPGSRHGSASSRAPSWTGVSRSPQWIRSSWPRAPQSFAVVRRGATVATNLNSDT